MTTQADSATPSSTAKVRRIGWSGLVMWLERHGIDCSRESNEDDALVIALLVGMMACLGMLAFSAWWSGFIAATTIFGLPVFLEKRKLRKST